MLDNLRPTVSIVIKALNEERHIAAAIESALVALGGMNGEVIVADSGSTDRTCDIARQYPVKVVRMRNVADRSCGAGAQLGFQYSGGRYVCLIDGDMQMRPGFLAAAVQFLDDHPDIAGVGGMLRERESTSLEYRKRNVAEYAGRQAGPVGRLDGGGLYQRAAIESVGYLTDRNLHGGEELELGARLTSAGWTLARLALPDVDHHGHAGNAYRLLLLRWRTRMCFGFGEVLRAAISGHHFCAVVWAQRRTLLLLAMVHAWWLCLLAAPFLAGSPLKAAVTTAILVLFPIVAMSLRFRSIRLGLYSVVAWQVYAVGFWPGLLRSRVSPKAWIASIVVHDGSQQRSFAAVSGP